LHQALRDDFSFYAPTCLKIIDRTGKLVSFEPKVAQMRLDAKLEEQRLAGEPQRALNLKARKIGFSTYCQGKAIQRSTQRENHRALTVGQDISTAGELFDMGEIMYVNLPNDPALGIKPGLRNRRARRALYFGEGATAARLRGDIGLNSSFAVDTAKEVEAGRGYTYHTLHLSEVAFWPDPKKLISLLNAMPDDADTLAVQESTANGFNHFKKSWDQAIAGNSAWVAHFEPWLNEPLYSLPFLDDGEREHFLETIGTGPYGQDEPGLMDLGATAEQLAWRRRIIEMNFDGDVRVFKQEFPATDGEAFLSSGETVFSPLIIERTAREVAQHDPETVSPDNPGPDYGKLVVTKRKLVPTPYGQMEIPAGYEWRPMQPTARVEGLWRIWQHPEKPEDPDRPRSGGQYVAAMDPASGEVVEHGKGARHSISIIDHKTRIQVAEYVSREDADLAGEQLYLAALLFNQAWVAVEITGGYGLSIARRFTRVYKYPKFYRRRAALAPVDDEQRQIGWSTDTKTKPLMEDQMALMLREGSHGIRSRFIPFEMQTYIRDERGRTGPEEGSYADRLLSYMLVQMIALEKPILPDRKPGSLTSTMPGRIRDPVTGY
jgi:hypothetical protein